MRIYVRYVFVLAAVVLLSCRTTPQNAETPSSAASAGGSSAAEIPAGTELWVRLDKSLDSAKARAGDQFTAEVSSPVVLNGKEILPKGAKAVGHVTNATVAEQAGSSGLLTLQLEMIRDGMKVYKIQTRPITLQAPPLKQSPQSDPMVKRAADAVAEKAENLQFTITAPVPVQ